MKLKTRNFGLIEFDETKKITFPEGIPGFKELKKFIFIQDEDEGSPFVYLQSIEDGEVSFVLTNPYHFKSDYTVDIKESYIEKLGGGEVSDFSLFVIVTVPKSFEEATINLIAPIIVQNDTKLGFQIILQDTKYNTKHRLEDLLKERS